MKLAEKVIVITGGAGGIGSVISRFFTAEGARVVVFDMDGTTLPEEGFHVDVADYHAVSEAVLAVLGRFWRIDGLVNCAGIQAPIGPFATNDMAEWRANIMVNLLGTVHMCRAVVPEMMRQKEGFIINFSGGGASSARVNFSAYASAKTAIVRFTETLADELRSYGVRVNAVAPGAVNTRMLDEVLGVGERAGDAERAAAEQRAKDGGTPPELVAELAVFLASRDSGNLSGRLVSAVWDNWKTWTKEDIAKIMAGESLTLRRVAYP